LLQSRADLDATKADAARAAVRTFRSLGGGWDAPQQQVAANN
jgi:outer membrane protein TolC